MRTLLSILTVIALFHPQFSRGQQAILEQYIQSGLEHNLVLQEKQIDLTQALLILKSAKSYYLPEVHFQTSYSTAKGGRNIPLPIGDLLNGVYATLNQMSGSPDFPQVENQTINFLPQNFYDARIRTSIPIIQTSIARQVNIRKRQVHLEGYQVDIYRRELVSQIKTAYFNYLMALEGVQVYVHALKLAQEGQRMHEKLLASGKGLPAYVLRSKSEVAQIEAELSQAEDQVENVRLYFNALLNRPADVEIDAGYDAESALNHTITEMHKQVEVNKREELLALGESLALNQEVIRLHKAQLIPSLSGFIDLGSQAENFAFNSQSRYYMLGLQLDVPIFSGNRKRNQIKQAALDLQATELKMTHTRRQLQLSVQAQENRLQHSHRAYKAACRQLEAARSYHRLIQRGYQAGVHSYIESVDARNQAIQAQISVNVHKFQVLIAAADLEREQAAYSFKNTSNHEAL